MKRTVFEPTGCAEGATEKKACHAKRCVAGFSLYRRDALSAVFFECGNHVFGTGEDFADAGADHVGGCCVNTQLAVDTHVSDAAVLHLGTELFGHLRGRIGSAKGDFDTLIAQHFGQHHGSNAHGEDRFVEADGGEDGLFDVGAHLHRGTVEGKCGEVARGTHTSGEGEGVELCGIEQFERFDFSASHTRRLGEEVAAVAVFVAVEVAYNSVKVFGGKALIVPSPAVDGEEEGKGFLELASVAVAATGKNDCNVIDSGVFGSSETIFITCHSKSFRIPSPDRRGLG